MSVRGREHHREYLSQRVKKKAERRSGGGAEWDGEGLTEPRLPLVSDMQFCIGNKVALPTLITCCLSVNSP